MPSPKSQLILSNVSLLFTLKVVTLPAQKFWAVIEAKKNDWINGGKPNSQQIFYRLVQAE
jgi:hypothetical protein